MRTRPEPISARLDRQRERAALDGPLEDLRSGRGRGLGVRGEAGVGKSALLEYAAEAAADMRVARAAGAESEMELAFAGVHQLCAPLLDRLEGLPGPQRDALRIAFGLREGGGPDRFLVGLAGLAVPAGGGEGRSVWGGGGGGGAAVVGRGRWCAMAGCGVGAGAGVRGAASAGRAGGSGLRRARAGGAVAGACGPGGAGPAGPGRPYAAGLGGPVRAR